MADPVSWAVIAGGTALAGGAMGAMGAEQKGAAEAASYNANAQIADYNSKIQQFNVKVAQRNQAQAIAAGQSDARDIELTTARNLSTIRTTYGANNLAVTGSVLDVMQDAAVTGEYDAAKTYYKGELKAIAYSDEATGYQQKSDLAVMDAQRNRNAAGFATQAADISAVTQFLGGASKAASFGMKAA